MVPETAQWNTQLITFLFDGDTALKIQALFIDTSKEDSMIWMPAKDGVSSVKSTYKMLSYNDSDVHVEEWVTSWFFQYVQSKDDHWIYTVMIGAWIIWKDLCDVVFQGVTLNHLTSIRKIHYHLASHMHDSYTAVITNSNISSWKPPLESILKYNTNGSFDSDSNQFGTGVVLRNSIGHCIGIKGTYGNGALSPEAVECMAIREALLWAKILNHTKIQIEADAKLVIQSINGHSLLIQWENKNIIKEIKHLSSSFALCTFDFVNRDDNQVANAIARTTKETRNSTKFFGDFDSAIFNLLSGDQNASH
ncbi:uncharacterized protein LOC113280624 [Papaver somniferum]|uniref:uncharacterized protein LOC113280624 n=1 Tax=Papaver somniferum TaxID=3469 RepID=UPI000E702C6A|nr:uncharacterized protein LOC113280624 [Papaver somniferum]